MNPIYRVIKPFPFPPKTKSFFIAHVFGAVKIADISDMVTSPIGTQRLNVPGSWNRLIYKGFMVSNLKGSNIFFHSGAAPLTVVVDFSSPLNITVTFTFDALLLSINLIFSAFITATFNLPFYGWIIWDKLNGILISGSGKRGGS